MRSHVRGLLGLATIGSVYAAAVKDTVTTGSTTFNHQQCWTKGTSFDALLDDAFASNSMTLEKCADFCSDYKYLGVANGKECYCGDTLAGSGVASSHCNTACKGDTTETCGGTQSLNVYIKALPLTVIPSSGEFTHQSCWKDGSSPSHALSDSGFSSTKMTVAKCAGFCDGYTYFGVGNGNKCYCGDSVDPATSAAEGEEECNTPCSGASATACGGVGRMNLYKIPIASIPSPVPGVSSVAPSSVVPSAVSSSSAPSAASSVSSVASSSVAPAASSAPVVSSAPPSSAPLVASVGSSAPSSSAPPIASVVSSAASVVSSAASSVVSSAVSSAAPVPSSVAPSATSVVASSSAPPVPSIVSSAASVASSAVSSVVSSAAPGAASAVSSAVSSSDPVISSAASSAASVVASSASSVVASSAAASVVTSSASSVISSVTSSVASSTASSAASSVAPSLISSAPSVSSAVASSVVSSKAPVSSSLPEDEDCEEDDDDEDDEDCDDDDEPESSSSVVPSHAPSSAPSFAVSSAVSSVTSQASPAVSSVAPSVASSSTSAPVISSVISSVVPPSTLITSTSTTSAPASISSAADCIDCSVPLLQNDHFQNGAVATGNYYTPEKGTGWGLARSIPGEGALEVRNDDAGNFKYLWNQCPRTGRTTTCAVFINQIITVKAGLKYQFFTEFAMSNVRGQANRMEVYIETLPYRQRIFSESIFHGNTGAEWARWAPTEFEATESTDLVLTVAWRNDYNDAIIKIKEISITPSACSIPNLPLVCGAATPSSVAPSSTLSTSTTTPPTSTPPLFPPVQGYEWDNCWEEITPGRLLSGAETASDTMTLDACATFCTSWPYFGVEYGRECFCGSAPASVGHTASAIAQCNMPCAGNSTEICGAGNRVSVYHHPGKSGPGTGSGAGSVKLGCYTETSAGRTLAAKGMGDDGMSLQMCEASCAGYKYWGVEYGRECFCGNVIQPAAVEVGVRPDGECNMVCAGDATELCGAGNRVMIYERVVGN